jgi:hypothetical protein
MGDSTDLPLDHLWREYSAVFRDFDDLTLARWLCQTLGQLEGRSWRLSHPLVGAYRLAAQAAHDRQIWHKRLATPPRAYPESTCCPAPLLPLLTRDVLDSGLLCHHCDDTCVPFADFPTAFAEEVRTWAGQYAPVHAVAHWNDLKRKQFGKYEAQFEQAARQAQELLAVAGKRLAPMLLDHFPAVVWEDQDECLEVRPEDIKF